MLSNISLTFWGRCQEIKKATENVGFQIARLANRLRSATNWFENCPAKATHKKPAAKAAGFVFSAARRTCSPAWTRKQNRSDEVGTGPLG